MAARRPAVMPQARKALAAAPIPQQRLVPLGLGPRPVCPLKKIINKTPRARNHSGSCEAGPGTEAARPRPNPSTRRPGRPGAPAHGVGARIPSPALGARRAVGEGRGAPRETGETWLLVLVRRRGVATSPQNRVRKGSEEAPAPAEFNQ
ncbi:uncharacterized protein ACIGJ3_001725 [Trichechus inunguis]